MKQKTFNVFISGIVACLCVLQIRSMFTLVEPSPPLIIIEVEKAPTFKDKSPKEGLSEALEYYGILHPKIVYAQAVLETGHFKSSACINDNNLFGLYDSKNKRYYKFNHWTESVVAYKDYIQRRYEPPNDYYKFLSDIGYAEDPDYNNKLKRIVSRNDKRRSE